MELVLDFTQLLFIAQTRPVYLVWYLFFQGGWIIFVILFVFFFYKGACILWLNSRQAKYFATWEFVLLTIHIPKVNESGPKIVEHIFSTIAGSHVNASFPDKWLRGKFQETFSFEIVSVGGYIQFLIRTTKHFRNLVESAIYSQYPDAEIFETEDYTAFAPDNFPDDEYDMWATEIILVRDWAYPIRTYPNFEDAIEEPGEKKFKDPMAALLEIMARLTLDEHIWYQIVVEPISQDWAAHSKIIANKLLGRKTSKKYGILYEEVRQWFLDLWFVLFSVLGKVESTDKPSTVSLSSGEKKVVEAIEEKAAKIGFNVKIRFVYIAKHAAVNKALGVAGFFGALKQYNTVDMNAFRPHKQLTTNAVYGNIKKRIVKKQRLNMANYKARTLYPNPYILNLEELASLYHFPVAHVRNTMIKTADLKRIGAPISLPAKDFGEEEPMVEELTEPKGNTSHTVSSESYAPTSPIPTAHTPVNLPIIE